MRKCHRCVVVKASEQNMAIEPAETRKVRRAGAAKSFGIKVEKMSLDQISRHLVPKTVNLHHRNGRADKLASIVPRVISGCESGSIIRFMMTWYFISGFFSNRVDALPQWNIPTMSLIG